MTTDILSLLYLGRLRLRKVKPLAQGQVARKWWNHVLNPSFWPHNHILHQLCCVVSWEMCLSCQQTHIHLQRGLNLQEWLSTLDLLSVGSVLSMGPLPVMPVAAREWNLRLPAVRSHPKLNLTEDVTDGWCPAGRGSVHTERVVVQYYVLGLGQILGTLSPGVYHWDRFSWGCRRQDDP